MNSNAEEISFGNDDEEEVFYQESGSVEDNEFDSIVGALEEILLGDAFTTIQKAFCDEHCEKFSNSEENKVEYTELFQTYTTIIETTLDQQLTAKIPGFKMSTFEGLLVNRKDEIDTEIFDLLMSLGDFSEFKELMVAHKKMKESIKNGSTELLTIFGTHMVSEPPVPLREAL
mmetsp:Transcript_1762/g.1908  ORF Transcript_1762/g.1908 Transcript_1762/m.1908 type:complete len:173 (-) Transcript_1762:1440-1958(-)